MKNLTCQEFLQRHLPRLRFRWAGFRKVHKQVCKRLGRRMANLNLSGFSAYESYLNDHPEEWQIFDALLAITISRFYRDRKVFDMLGSEILPALARDIIWKGEKSMNCWSAGCCSGEEAYTLQILWKLRVVPAIRLNFPLRIIATDSDNEVIQRARQGCYPASSLRDLPQELIRKAFVLSGHSYKIMDPFAEDIEFLEQDIRMQAPEGFFHAIFCRNLVLTYFEESLQLDILQRISERLCDGGIFVVGIHETLPEGVTGMRPYDKIPGIYRKAE